MFSIGIPEAKKALAFHSGQVLNKVAEPFRANLYSATPSRYFQFYLYHDSFLTEFFTN
jgi:hypothetical protein